VRLIAYDSIVVSEIITVFILSLDLAVSDSIVVAEEVSSRITTLKPFIFDAVTVSEMVNLPFSSARNWHETVSVSEFFTAEIKTHTRSTLNTPFGGYIPDVWIGTRPLLWLCGETPTISLLLERTLVYLG